MYNRAVILTLLLTLLATGVFGALLMSASGESGMTCALPTMGNMDCAAFSNALAMLEHHIGAYQGLFTAVLAIVTGVLLFVVLLIIRDAVSVVAPPSVFSSSYSPDAQTAHDRVLYRWLACLRNKDAFALSRVHVMSS